VDQDHGAGARVHVTSLIVSHSSGDLWLGLNEPKGYLALLILAVHAGMDDLWLVGVGRYQWSGAPNTMGKKAKQRGGHEGAHLG
jgi:hypothetical protein